MEENRELELALQYVESTQVSLFLTGKAGTGKTTFLRRLSERTRKRHVVLAPTGVAAINAGGVTIHSFFQLPFCPYLPDVPELVTEYQMPESKKQLRKSRQEVIRTLDLLIIDEVSMVRADLLDAVDMMLRRYRHSARPFGGVQLLMIGDLQQLPPVVKEEERRYLEQVYPTPFFFASKALQRLPYYTIELQRIYRQQDEEFVEMLNMVRENRLTPTLLDRLNSRYRGDFDPDDSQGYIQLTTHNAQADAVNQNRLERLETKEHCFEATVTGDFPTYAMPTDASLRLKVGAQVMFVRNNMGAGYFNGKIGRVTAIDAERGIVVTDGEGTEIGVGRERWENIQYAINPENNQIEAQVAGTFDQYPLRVAWAITIHKSQGLTFDHVILDASRAFVYGQVYVALSRCRTLEGLVLSSRITSRCAFDNSDVAQYSRSFSDTDEMERSLPAFQQQYRYDLLQELFDLARLHHVLLRLNDHVQQAVKNVYPNVAKAISAVANQRMVDLIGVNERFMRQVQQLWQEGTEAAGRLDERLRKAATYYGKEMGEMRVVLGGLSHLELDNKEQSKQLAQLLGECDGCLDVKLATLGEVAERGFDLEAYKKAKYDALLQADQQPAKPKKLKAVDGGVEGSALYEALRNWRKMKSQERQVPAYMVLSQKTLMALTQHQPRTLQQLGTIVGVGKVTIQRYGETIIDIVREYGD